jgi:hypothetical protein
MRLGETIATYDVGLALRGKSGKFEVTSPDGDIYEVTCRPGHSNSNLEWSNNGADNAPFLIRRMSESAPLAEANAITSTPEENGQTAPSPLPFVLEHAKAGEPSSNASDLELLYLEDDSGTGQPSACIYLKGRMKDLASEGETLMTPRCATFNELDSEIRRLQAQLDDIRVRAKKMFYKTHTVAASA